jgi:TonB family protein
MRIRIGIALALGLSLAASSVVAAVEYPSASKRFQPLKILRTADPMYPVQLTERYIEKGEARIMIMVSEAGRLVDWMVTGYTHPLFAKEALEVLPKWSFEPATLHGEPVAVRTELRFLYRNIGRVRVVPGDMEMALRMKDIRGRDTFWRRICKMDELDQPPDAIVEIAPMPPDRLGAVAREGKVVVEYFIDPEGRVRMPIVLSSDDEAFSQSVLLALTGWKYAPPTCNGQPVLAHVAREFTFKAVD